MKRTGIEKLDSGVEIDWDSHKTALNPTSKRNYQRLIRVSCITCKTWRWINSCGLWEYRKGKKGNCWECHRKWLAKKNQLLGVGRRHNFQGYVVRTLTSFTQEESKLLKSMMRLPHNNLRGEILEHRAIMALYLKRPLNSKEIVHHINGIHDDNRIENLELVSDSKEHYKHHMRIYKENQALHIKIQQLEQQLSSLQISQNQLL